MPEASTPEAPDPSAAHDDDAPLPTPVSQADGTLVAHTVDAYGEERTVVFDSEEVHRPPSSAPTEEPQNSVAELDHLVHLMGEEASVPTPTLVMSEDGIWHTTRVDEYGDVRDVSHDSEEVRFPVETPREITYDTELVQRGEPSDHPEAFEAVHEAHLQSSGHDTIHDADPSHVIDHQQDATGE